MNRITKIQKICWLVRTTWTHSAIEISSERRPPPNKGMDVNSGRCAPKAMSRRRQRGSIVALAVGLARPRIELRRRREPEHLGLVALVLACGEQRQRVGAGLQQRLHPDLDLGLAEVGEHMAHDEVFVARMARPEPRPAE